VLIVDDVISAGTSVRESITMITAAGGTPCGVAIALDRQERATQDGADAPWSAVQYVTNQLNLKVVAIAELHDLLQYLRRSDDVTLGNHAAPVQAYRDRYGV
jgi:orotate phosphoribosyltransferase